MSREPDESLASGSANENRRTFLSTMSSAAMAGGLVAGYGSLAVMAGRFLYPAKGRETNWVYVSDVAGLKEGATVPFRMPNGQVVTITRVADTGAVSDFLALSTVCPHLGCRVHWEAQNNRFFCPCHNGAFDPGGKAIAGPPAEAKQSLSQYPLRVEKGLLFIEVALERAG